MSDRYVTFKSKLGKNQQPSFMIPQLDNTADKYIAICDRKLLITSARQNGKCVKIVYWTIFEDIILETLGIVLNNDIEKRINTLMEFMNAIMLHLATVIVKFRFYN